MADNKENAPSLTWMEPTPSKAGLSYVLHFTV